MKKTVEQMYFVFTSPFPACAGLICGHVGHVFFRKTTLDIANVEALFFCRGAASVFRG